MVSPELRAATERIHEAIEAYQQVTLGREPDGPVVSWVLNAYIIPINVDDDGDTHEQHLFIAPDGQPSHVSMGLARQMTVRLDRHTWGDEDVT